MDGRLLTPGDRVAVRDRTWRIDRLAPLDGGAATRLQLSALDDEEPRSLSVIAPPDEVAPLPSESLSFDLRGLEAFGPWLRAHRLLAATSIQDDGYLTGARYGRVALEAYQLAPTLRALSKPRPRLLIADDVGLGKTIEAGLVLLELQARGRAKRTLIVVPPGLLRQWKAELLEKFGLDFEILENADGLSRVQGSVPAGVSPWDVLPRVLTSVDFLKKETVYHRALRKPWDLVIVDEAHGLAEAGSTSNPYRTRRTRLGTALREASRGFLLLTATPHNGYIHSFQSLIELVEPTAASLTGAPEDVARRVGSSMVRRMKSQIVKRLPDGSMGEVFPKRTVKGIPVVITAADRDLLHRVSSYCSRTARAAEADDRELVSFAMQIVKKRALSSHAALGGTIENRLRALSGKEPEEKIEKPDLRDFQADLPMDEASAERTAKRIVRAAVPKELRARKAEATALRGIQKLLKATSGSDPKIEALVAEIREVTALDPPEKLIVFTEYLDTLFAVKAALESGADLANRIVVLRGGMSARKRAEVQTLFEGPDILILLATDAASEGLNLQWQCHRILHFELPWNPNRMEQRNGRVDRYGQVHPPVIRYLFYPDSPEEQILDRLVTKIEKMQGSHVSTPDILGVFEGAVEISRGLVELDAEKPSMHEEMHTLERLFDDRTADFIRNVQPFLSAPDLDMGETEVLERLLKTNQPLLPDDVELEHLVVAVLGTGNATQLREGVFRLSVPARYRGPSVRERYPAVTFRRSLAARLRPDEVEYVTPMHPLVLALSAQARRQLLQVFSDERGMPPRRLAARRVSASEAPSILFSFIASVPGDGHALEEKVITVRVGVDETLLPDVAELLASDEDPGDVPAGLLEVLFSSPFSAMAAAASQEARNRIGARAAELRVQRKKQGDQLRRDLEADTADRLAAVADEERRASGLVETGSSQLRLFADRESRSTSFETRRAAIRSQNDVRRDEIAGFELVGDPPPPRPLGALFLVPEGS